MSSLYVHIPFCKAICSYCDFPKVIFKKEWAFSYLQALFVELDHYEKKIYDTIYVGGGTPTSLSDEIFESLLKRLSFYRDEHTEFTIEANPDSLTDEKLSLCRIYGVNRLSIGMESSVTRLLTLMKRTHKYLDVICAVNRAKSFGFGNINVDLIYGFPEENEVELKEDIHAALSLDVPHISAYTLSVSPGTLFYLKGVKEAEDDLAAKQYEMILSSFRGGGFSRYEVSNFAKKGFQCRHNLTYWKDKHYDAIGLGASGYCENVRYTNTRNFTKYLKGEFRDFEEIVSPKDDLEYYFLTNLRLEEGFALNDFQSHFGFSFLYRYEKEFFTLRAQNLLKEEGERIKPTDQGILLLDRILLVLFP